MKKEWYVSFHLVWKEFVRKTKQDSSLQLVMKAVSAKAPSAKKLGDLMSICRVRTERSVSGELPFRGERLVTPGLVVFLIETTHEYRKVLRGQSSDCRTATSGLP